ncbi:MAG: ShlB/FhaC/HecB family hemolysin secretion/activation protein [Gammaproteobacteria bacterium]
MPNLDEPRRLPQQDRGGVVIPSMLERLENDSDAGPQIPVSKFLLYANRNAETAWRGGEYVAQVERTLQNALDEQPAGGYTLGQIGALANTIQSTLRNDGMLLAQVFVPVQQVVDGEVAIQIMEGRVGDIVAQGNDRYSTDVLKKPLDDLAGKAVDTDDVERSVLLLRDYPGIAVAGVFNPGNELGTTNLTLRVQDEDPLAVRFAYDNYGSEFTGETRTFASVDWNSPLGLGDQLTVSTLKSWDPDNGNYGAIGYLLPFFSPGTYLDFGFVENSFRVGRRGSALDSGISGDTTVANVGLISKLKRGRNANITSAVNVLSKRATVEDTANDRVNARDKLTLLDLNLSFDFVDTRFRGLNSGAIGFAKGFADVLGSLDEGDPGVDLGSSRRNSVNTFAGGKFEKWYAQFSRLQSLTEHSQLLLRTDMQASDDLLLSLEQFALGGPNSVRAFPPAEFLVDTGGFVSLEWILAAPFFADKAAFSGYSWGDLFHVSFYFDYAGGYLSEVAFGEEKTRDLSGYGIGIDFRLPGRFSTRLDIAEPRGAEDPSNGRDRQIYFTMNVSF